MGGAQSEAAVSPRSSGKGRLDEEHDIGETILGKINIVLEVDPVHIRAEEVLARDKVAFVEKKIQST